MPIFSIGLLVCVFYFQKFTMYYRDKPFVACVEIKFLVFYCLEFVTEFYFSIFL